MMPPSLMDQGSDYLLNALRRHWDRPWKVLASRRRQGQPRTLPSFALIRATCEGERSPKGPVGVPPRELERHLRHL